ncbi:DUF4288 domain-containing protein [Mucilaginibacter ginkgonis]|uniref:DUF4288 domain-containing protein n=1 Tax=Mucilaginibacter ginkgonis TaxID=2682091 RepID=A0A6I4HVL3_9SPHI|nr:DUF4288 domain-containing protein [Mucilaginibacter ginkgonis]QQL49862.1 DUF4288 domain-containing protein [Mucilaginibacter ginkgonis]
MNWYVVKIIFRIISNENGRRAQFDEQLRLVKAASKYMAFEKAGRLGRSVELQYLNNSYNQVKWQFVNVAEVNELNALEDGTELYCNIHEAPNADVYEGWTNHKAALISLDN